MVPGDDLTAEEAESQKQEASQRVAPKIWRVTNRANRQQAVDFVNLSPAQGAGEVSMTNRSDGTVDVYYYL